VRAGAPDDSVSTALMSRSPARCSAAAVVSKSVILVRPGRGEYEYDEESTKTMRQRHRATSRRLASCVLVRSLHATRRGQRVMGRW
jgi:hypothetical protein